MIYYIAIIQHIYYRYDHGACTYYNRYNKDQIIQDTNECTSYVDINQIVTLWVY